MGIGLGTPLRHVAWSRTASVALASHADVLRFVASLHEINPKAVLSFSAVLRQVFFVLPRLLPSRAQVNAVLGCLHGSILRMKPMNSKHRRGLRKANILREL